MAAQALVALAAIATATPASSACESFDTPDRTTHRLLSLDDFRGKPPLYMRLTETGRFVIHRARIQVRVVVLDLGIHVVASAGGMTASVTGPCVMAVMLKNGSGANANRMDAGDLLHEQLHFDIAHHFAGVLSERLAGVEFTSRSVEELELGIRARVREIVASVVSQEQATQRRFDRETQRRGVVRTLARWGRCMGMSLASTPEC